jgi:hypothetical protein
MQVLPSVAEGQIMNVDQCDAIKTSLSEYSIMWFIRRAQIDLLAKLYAPVIGVAVEDLDFHGLPERVQRELRELVTSELVEIGLITPRSTIEKERCVDESRRHLTIWHLSDFEMLSTEDSLYYQWYDKASEEYPADLPFVR